MVSRPVRDREIAGSNPAFPTIHNFIGVCRRSAGTTFRQPPQNWSGPWTFDIMRLLGAMSITRQKNGPFKSIEE